MPSLDTLLDTPVRWTQAAVDADTRAFLDDLQANIRGAREAGAVGVLHDDPDTTIGEVEILLALPD